MEVNKSRRGIKRGLTNVFKHYCYFEWRINGISSYFEDFDSKKSRDKLARLQSPEFSTGSAIGDRWNLELIVDHPIYSEHSVIGLMNIGKFDLSKKLQCSLIMFDNECLKDDHEEFNQPFWLCSEGDFELIFPTIKLVTRKNELTPNDTLTIGVELTLFDDSCYSVDSIEFSPKHQRMIDHFEYLYQEKLDIDADIVIKVQDQIFKAHRTILMARCPDFFTIFTTQKDENKKDCVTIDDMDPNVFKTILDFIYTDEADDLEENFEDLFKTADKWKLQKLREICQLSFYQILNCKNALRLLVLATDYKIVELSEYITDFIVRNAEQVVKTPEYQAIIKSNPSIGINLLKKFAASKVDGSLKFNY